MKKAFLFAMIILILLSGCNGGSSGNDIDKPEINFSPGQTTTNEPVATNDEALEATEAVYLLSVYQPSGSKDEKYFNLSDWQDYIKGKFDIEINIFYSSRELRSAQAVYYFNYRIGYPFTKVYQAFDYINTDMAYDLTPYYEYYGWNNFIDNSYMQELTVDGKIFAVPTAPTKYIIPRYYNADYLNELDMVVPTDINGFYEYLVKSKEIMEGDGVLLPMFIPNQYMFSCTADIFRAFGAYVNSENNDPMSFNPQTQSFEDAIFSENIESALAFIKDLQEKKLLGILGEAQCPDYTNNENQFIGDRFKVNKTFATEYYAVYDSDANYFLKSLMTEPSYEAKSGYYLTHINTDKVCEIRSDMGFYVFPKKISNIQGTIDLFNSIMTDKSYYPDLLYGMENTDYEVINDKAFPMVPDKGTFPGIRLIASVDDSNNYFAHDNIDIVDQISQNLLYESSIFNYTGRYRSIVGGSSHSGSFKDNLFMTCVSPADAVEEYKKTFFGWGYNETLKMLNERINAVPAYDYTP